MDLFDQSFHAAVHDFRAGGRRGCPALGPRIGVKPNLLGNYADPRMDGHIPNIEVFRSICLTTGDLRPLDAIEAENGRFAIAVVPPDVTSESLLESLALLTKENGELAIDLHEARKHASPGGRGITSGEALKIEQSAIEVAQAVMALAHRAKVAAGLIDE